MTNELTVVRTPESIAAEIRTIDAQTKEIAIRGAIEIGKRLDEAKQLVQHGEWGDWLKANVNYSQSTANNFMRIAKEYEENSQAIPNLPYTHVVHLLGVPAEEREAFAQEVGAENLSSRELQEEIKKRKDAEAKAKDLKKRAEEAEQAAEEERKVRRELEEQLEQSAGLAEEHEQMKELLAQAEESGSTEKVDQLQLAMKNLEDELKETRERAEQLDKQLKEKPIETSVTVEVVPPDIQAELEALRAKDAKRSGDEADLKFRVSFDAFRNARWVELLVALDDLQDEGIRAKYGKAIGKMLGSLQEELQEKLG